MSMTSDGADNVGDEVSTGSKAVEATVLCIIISVSIVGNTSLWIVVLQARALRTVTNMFILGLSAAGLYQTSTCTIIKRKIYLHFCISINKYHRKHTKLQK